MGAPKTRDPALRESRVADREPIDEQELHDALDLALDEAARLGAGQAEAVASVGQGFEATVRLGDVETITHHRDRGMMISVYFGARNGSASTSDYGRGAVLEAVRAACSIARLTEEDAANGLPDPHRLATEFPDLDLDHPTGVGVQDLVDEARECEDAALGMDERIVNSDGASSSCDRGVDLLGNSLGFRGLTRNTRFSASCTVIGKTESGMQRDYWYDVARRRDDLDAPASIGATAGRRTLRRLDARRMKTGKHPVLFEAPVAASLLSHLVRAASGGALYKKASFLLDRIDERIFPEFVRVHEQPLLPKAMGSASFDNEGVATLTRDIVSDGVLRGYVLGSYSARRLGMETTGNAGGVHNLTIDGGSRSFEELLAEMDRGLLVTELVGFGINMVTGDYSRGASGFWVERGEIQYPVEELTIAGNLARMFMDLADVGADVDLRGNVRTGSILVSEMTVAGE